MYLLQASQKFLCCYTNPTSRIQIIKIPNTSTAFFERAVMPHGTVLFEAERTAHLEVHTSEMVSTVISDVIPCSQLVKGPNKRRNEHPRVSPERVPQPA